MISSALCTNRLDLEPSAVTLAKKSAVLELGSAFQLIVADPWTRRVTARVEAKVDFGEGYERHGLIDDEAWTNGLGTAAALAARGRALGSGGLGVFATGPARDALNASSFVEAVRSRVGLPVEVVAPEREAALVHRAAMHAEGSRAGLLVVVGRSSVELAFGRGASPAWIESLGFGAATLAEELGDETGATSAAACREIDVRVARTRARLSRRGALRAPVPLVLAGPAMAALAELADGTSRRVTLAHVRALSLALEGLSAAHVRRVCPGAPPNAAWLAPLVASLLDALGASVARVTTATAADGLVAG